MLEPLFIFFASFLVDEKACDYSHMTFIGLEHYKKELEQ